MHSGAAAAEAHAVGAVVVLARCPPEPTIAFEPWVRAIGELARAGGDGWRAGLAKAAGAEVSALVPELGEHAGASMSAASSEMVAAEGARYRLLRGIGAALSSASADAPRRRCALPPGVTANAGSVDLAVGVGFRPVSGARRGPRQRTPRPLSS